MHSQLRRAILISTLFCLGGCTSAGATKRGVVRFNEVFAESRNEILLLNILRARHGEAQQFSTVSSVTGSMRPSIEGGATIANVAQDFAEVLSPTGKVTLRNPSVTIAPLETKEFREGMMKPVDAEFVQRLIEAGWNPSTVLNLVVQNSKCGSTNVVSKPLLEPEHRADPSTVVSPWQVKPLEVQKVEATIRLPATDAAKAMREGFGKGLKVELAKSEPGDPPDTVRIQLKKEAEQRIVLGPGAQICGPQTVYLDKDSVTTRSPAAMIQYLAQQPVGTSNPYFETYTVFGRKPDWALVGARYRDQVYVVPRQGRSAETMALLAEIIGFQTTNAQLNASKPTVTVSSEGGSSS